MSAPKRNEQEKKESSTTAAMNEIGAVEAAASHLHPTPSWDVADCQKPAGIEKIWRSTPLRRSAGLLTEGDALPGLDQEGETPAGAESTIMPVSVPRDLAAEPPVDRVVVLTVARSAGLALMRVPAGTELGQANVHVGTGNGVEVARVLVLGVGANSRAATVFHYRDSGSCITKYDIRTDDGAEVNLVYINNWDADAIHDGQISLGVGCDARVCIVQASLGGAVIRFQENTHFAGPDDEPKQYGLYFADAGQCIQYRLSVGHNAPKIRSNMGHHGALQGEGVNSVWIGDVLTRKVIGGIRIYKSDKNLIFTDDCRADFVLNLEIEVGETEGAGHGSTTSRSDDLQLFYLRSRGIPEIEARRLVVHGFLNDIIRRIGVPEIEERLLIQMEEELDMAVKVMRATQ